MTKTQFLIYLIALIPLLNALAVKICADFTDISDIIIKISPILFLASLIGLYGNFGRDDSYILLAEAAPGVSLGFAIDRLSLSFLFLLNFIWIIFAFYSQRFFQKNETQNSNQLRIFFALIIAFVSLVIISENLMTILFFYSCLIALGHFFSLKLLYKKEDRLSKLFTSLRYFELIFLFLTIAATYKFIGQIEFANGGIIPDDFSEIKQKILLGLYVVSLFLSVLFPCYLFYRNISLNPLILYVFFFLSYAISSIYILLKILILIFGIENFSSLISGFSFTIIESVFLFNIAVISVFLLFSRGIKSSFFYLFFQQFIFALFSIFIFISFDSEKAFSSVLSFSLSITLVFLCISNIVSYIENSEGKTTDGLFFNLKITIILLIFAIANMAGLAPGIGFLEKFFIIKIILQKKLFLSGLIILINSLSLLVFAGKMIYPFFLCQDEQNTNDLSLAKDIEYDSSLILSTVTVAIVIFLSLIFFPFLTKFL